MNGVDIADQLRASYHTHLRGVRNWLPLFYWLVDTLKVNSFLIWRLQYPDASHKKFQLAISRQLINEGLQEHENQLMQERVVNHPTLGNPIPGFPPPQITSLGPQDVTSGKSRYRIDNIVHCLTYIHSKKILVRQCVACKKQTCFHCANCQNALCSGKISSCINMIACSYITIQ